MIKKKIFILSALLGLIFLFQNCGEFKTVGSTSSSEINSNEPTPPSNDTGNSNQDPPSSNPTPPTHTPPSPPNSSQYISVFLAAGHMGRSIASCDGGRTWIKDRSADDQARCWVGQNDPNYVECDHTPFSSTGFDSGDGWIFMSTGWGHDGFVTRSQDGVNWEVMHQGFWGGGLAYYGGRISLMWGGYRRWSNSTDLGATWNSYDRPSPMGSHEFIYRVNNKFFSIGRGPGLAVSLDQGRNWTVAENFLQEWGAYFTEGNGRVVSIGTLRGSGNTPSIGYAAVSLDGGLTWSGQEILRSTTSSSFSGLVFSDGTFKAWIGNQLWESSDGVVWSHTEDIAISGSRLAGPISYNPSTQTYASIPQVWGQNYERQRAYFSLDGVQWQESDQFDGGHPIRRIIVGEVHPSFCE